MSDREKNKSMDSIQSDQKQAETLQNPYEAPGQDGAATSKREEASGSLTNTKRLEYSSADEEHNDNTQEKQM